MADLSVAAYIAFEGGEGSGKSTQTERLAAEFDAVLTREPGATELGFRLRSLLLDPDSVPVGPRAEALLMAADRAQHMQDVVLPALAAGQHVVSDRSAYSSLAYQGGGRQLGVEEIREVNKWAVYGRWPDVVVYLRLDRDVAKTRLRRSLDRIEREDEKFHRRIGRVFDQLADEDADRWLVVEADQPIDVVAAEVSDGVLNRLANLGFVLQR